VCERCYYLWIIFGSSQKIIIFLSLYLCTLINDDDSNNSSSSKAIKHTHPSFPNQIHTQFFSLSRYSKKFSMGMQRNILGIRSENYPLSSSSSMFSKIKHNERKVNGSAHKTCFEGRTFNIKNPVKLDYNFTLFLFTHSLAACEQKTHCTYSLVFSFSGKDIFLQ
jgi:hypothetical protein